MLAACGGKATSGVATGGGAESTVGIGEVCVVGSTIGADGLVQVDVMVRPKGCLSSALEQLEVACALTAGEDGTIAVTGTFRYRSGGHGSSLPDCSGGGVATCSLGGLPQGAVTFTTDGGLSLPLTLPLPPPVEGDRPAGSPGSSTCVGSPF